MSRIDPDALLAAAPPKATGFKSLGNGDKSTVFLANGGLVPTGHQWLITRFGKPAATVSTSDLGQTLSDGKFRNGASCFKGTQTGGVRVQNSTLIFPNEEKAASMGQSVAVVFPNGPDGETTSPNAGLHIEGPSACPPKKGSRVGPLSDRQ